jgi:2',3'-cyclic-nucleotide 2'-phosphodiesterase (5'-nucleotidase family)
VADHHQVDVVLLLAHLGRGNKLREEEVEEEGGGRRRRRRKGE